MRAIGAFGLGAWLVGASAALALDANRTLDQYSADVWQAEHGLPQNSVQALLQTRDGYLWAATEEGLARFDGVRFTILDRTSRPGMPGDNVQALLEARDGSMWLGIYGGGLFRLGPTAKAYGVADGLLSDTVTALAQDAAGTLWIGTSRGLNRLRDGRLDSFTTRDGLPHDAVRCLRVDGAGTLWIGTAGGLARLAPGATGSGFTTQEGLLDPRVTSLGEDASGNLWIGTEKGLHQLSHGRIAGFRAGQSGLRSDYVRAIQADRDGSLWIGTQGGLHRWREDRFESMPQSGPLGSDIVYALLEDREGTLWAGTIGAGLVRLRSGSVASFTTRHGLPPGGVNVIATARDGGLWVGGWSGEVTYLRSTSFRTVDSHGSLRSGDIFALHEDAGGDLWIGTQHGLVRYSHGSFQALPQPGLTHIRALAEDAAGTLWIGTDSNGAFKREGTTFVHVGAHEGLADPRVRVLHRDRRGDLWIGTYGGLNRLHQGQFTLYTTAQGLPSNLVRSLLEDADGVLWIGTYGGGIARMKDGRIRAFGRRDGLPSDVAYQILDDGTGALWVSGNKGLYRVAKAELEAVATGQKTSVRTTTFGKSDGMSAIECSGGSPAGARAPDGTLWFPTIGGVVAVDPARLVVAAPPPPVVVEEARADEQTLDLAHDIVVGPGREKLEFRYTGLGLRAPERVAFRYRLSGLDHAWVEAGARRTAYYTNVPPGRYVFEVEAKSGEGAWSEHPASLALELRPHFYRTTWFRLLVGAALLSCAIVLYLLRVRQLKARQAELVRLVDARTADLREAVRLKEEIVSLVAHDFRSPLTVIQGYSEVIEGRVADPEIQKLLRVIRRQVEHLASLAGDTLTMSRIEAGRFPMERARVQLTELVRAVVESHQAQAAGLLSLDVAEAVPDIEGDPERLHQVVDNLVGNALKYGRDSRVRVAVRAAPGGVQVSVSDAGPGIAPESIALLFKKFSRLPADRGIQGTGLGLFICRSIIEAHGGRIWVESEPGAGTTFHFVVPSTPAASRQEGAA